MVRILMVALVSGMTFHAAHADDKPSNEADESFKKLMSEIQIKGTDVAVTDFSVRGMWTKRKQVAFDVKFEINRTGSPPETVARATWKKKTYITGQFPTKDEAEKATLPSQPRADSPALYWADFVYKEGTWVVKDVGWTAPPSKFERKHSTTVKASDSIHDWWRALGGK